MFVYVELKHLLLQVLPSPAMMAQGRLLCIQNHLAMVCDSLWAINSMIVILEMGMLYNDYLLLTKWDQTLDVPVEFADWARDVAAAVIDVGELLGRILDWEASFHRSIVGSTQQVNFRRVILVELKEILYDLNSLVLRGSAIGLRRDPMHSMNPLQEDYSIILKNGAVGREEDLEKLITIFQEQQQPVPSNNNGDDSNPFAIVIVGKQGVGKTTLAHMIYHHTWVRQQFHRRIWVDLPLHSTVKMINIIGKEFAKSISKEEYGDQPLQAMWEYINEQLDGSRYLLVLHCHDFSSLMQQQEWNELKNILLRVGGPGTVVLIVEKSSAKLVSDMGFLNGAKDIITYCLNPLSEDAWLELFKRHAATPIPPSKLEKSENDELIPFVKQHFQNLIDQTLSAKIVGSLSHDIQATLAGPLPAIPEALYMLRNCPLSFVRLHQYPHLLDADNVNDYNVILHMLNAECLIPVEGIAPGWIDRYDRFFEEIRKQPEFLIQKMVYLHMKVPEDSTTIPRCCRNLCLEINPRAIPFRLPAMPIEVRNKLIALILQEDEETTQEDVEDITLQVYKRRRMKAATAISKFLNKISVRLIHLRILVVETSMIQSLPSEVSKFVINLRYLHLSKIKMELLPKSLFNLPNLRILSLLHCEKLQKIPERIHKLKKLQILKLAYCTKLQELPKSITRLKNLEEFNVEGCCYLRKLPEDLVSFKTLRILNIEGCTSLSQIPRGIEQLIGLRKLSGIFVGDGVDGGFGFAQLQALTNLEEIRLRNLERAEETQTEVLMGQQRLRHLSLHWGGVDANESSESVATPLQLFEALRPNNESSESAATPLQIFEALRPNVHLERLEIISYKGVEFPTWMSKQQLVHFDSLEEVRLINLRRCATLPSLGQLCNLEELVISGMDLIKQIDDTFYGDGDIFPTLTKITFSEMLALEKWMSVSERKNADFFPKLKQLTLIQCPKLKEIDLRSLRDGAVTMRVWLNNETIWSAEFCDWNNLQCITRIEIVGCRELRCLPQGMRRLKRLTEMTINSCNNLATLVALDSLRELYLYACPVLAFNLEAFTKLSQLKIKGCPKMQIYLDAWMKTK